MHRETYNLGHVFLENESKTWMVQGVDSSVSHYKCWFLLNGHEMLTLTSTFILCLILFMLPHITGRTQAFLWGCNSVFPLSGPQLKVLGNFSLKECGFYFWLQVMLILSIYLTAVIRVWEDRTPEQRFTFLSSNVNTLENKQGNCFWSCHLFAFSTWPLSK